MATEQMLKLFTGFIN